MRYKPFTFLGQAEGRLRGCISASGGIEVILDPYKYHIFTGSFAPSISDPVFTTQSFVVHSNPCNDPLTALTVAKGGDNGPVGAGAGGGVETSSFSPTTGSYIMATFVSGTYGNGDSIAFSGSVYEIIAQRGGNGASNSIAAVNGGGGSPTYPTGALNVYNYSGSDYNAGGSGEYGAGAGVGGNAIVRPGDSSIGGIGVFIAEFAPLDGQFSEGGNAQYYGGYPAGWYGGGGGGALDPVQFGAAQEGGGGVNKYPASYDAPSAASEGSGVPFTGGGAEGRGPGALGGKGIILIRYLA
jgi:hypothetical protein